MYFPDRGETCRASERRIFMRRFRHHRFRHLRLMSTPDRTRTSGDWKFAAGIAAFTGRLRGSSYFESIEMSEVINLLKAGTKQNSYREELVRMVEQ